MLKFRMNVIYLVLAIYFHEDLAIRPLGEPATENICIFFKSMSKASSKIKFRD